MLSISARKELSPKEPNSSVGGAASPMAVDQSQSL